MPAWSASAARSSPHHAEAQTPARRPTRTLVINGAECEPFITCDDMLMRERADGESPGRAIPRCATCCPAESADRHRGQQARGRRRRCGRPPSAAGDGHRSGRRPHRYPAGGAKQADPRAHRHRGAARQALHRLRRAVLQRRHRLQRPRGLELGRPLVSRIVTVAGNVERPRNFEVADRHADGRLLVRLARPAPRHRPLPRHGRPMMGLRLPRLTCPVVKATNCILPARPPVPAGPPEMPCIRCGECAKACPVDLQPFELYWFAAPRTSARPGIPPLRLHRCGCCAYVCPSRIPLVDYFRFSKAKSGRASATRSGRRPGRERFEFRNFRQEREKAEKAAKLAAKAAATRQARESRCRSAGGGRGPPRRSQENEA